MQHKSSVDQSPWIKFKWNSMKKSQFLQNMSNEKKKLKFSLLSSTLEEGHIDNAVQQLSEFLRDSAMSMIVKPAISMKIQQPKWWNDECSELKLQKYKLLDIFRITNFEDDLLMYKKVKSRFKLACTKSQKEQTERKSNEVIQSNGEDLWKSVRNFLKRSDRKPNIGR
ncbi:hypothetical protein SNE40_018360 [Patella caerulea]|uniref:Uncharacterized protein n=1 Tax=Patella caerulea TaxID=87958 RepID=A0AAN8J8K6_PATCE